VLLAEFAGAAVAIAGASALLKGSYKVPTALGHSHKGQGSGGGGGQAAKSEAAPPASSAKAAPSVPSDAVKLGPANALASGHPADGSPDILIRGSDGSLKAFSAVCTHAGCEVGYEGGVIVCPCHGGEYSAETGEVIAGPPPEGLAPKKVLEAGGEIYALPS